MNKRRARAEGQWYQEAVSLIASWLPLLALFSVSTTLNSRVWSTFTARLGGCVLLFFFSVDEAFKSF